MSAVAEALLEAHKQRASGWMTLTFWGRESKLLLKEGDVVGAQMGFGHQSALQGLLQSKKLTLSQLDALWARGDAGKADAETLEEVGASPTESAAQQVLAQVRRAEELGFDSVWIPDHLIIEVTRPGARPEGCWEGWSLVSALAAATAALAGHLLAAIGCHACSNALCEPAAMLNCGACSRGCVNAHPGMVH